MRYRKMSTTCKTFAFLLLSLLNLELNAIMLLINKITFFRLFATTSTVN